MLQNATNCYRRQGMEERTECYESKENEYEWDCLAKKRHREKVEEKNDQ